MFLCTFCTYAFNYNFYIHEQTSFIIVDEYDVILLHVKWQLIDGWSRILEAPSGIACHMTLVT